MEDLQLKRSMEQLQVRNSDLEVQPLISLSLCLSDCGSDCLTW
jgi:hypothetical protein